MFFVFVIQNEKFTYHLWLSSRQNISCHNRIRHYLSRLLMHAINKLKPLTVASKFGHSNYLMLDFENYLSREWSVRWLGGA